jgi:DNA-binding NtrC family response regulator
MTIYTRNGECVVTLAWGLFSLSMWAAAYGQKRRDTSGPGVRPASTPSPSFEKRPTPIKPLWELEKQAILNALEELNGDKLLTATKLGIGKTTLYRKLKKYGITVEPVIRRAIETGPASET